MPREDTTIGASLNILYAVHRVPFPPDKGDRIRAFHLLKFLAGQGKLYLASLADEPVPPSVEAALRQYCEKLEIVPVDWKRWPRALVSLIGGGTVSEGAFASNRLQRTIQEWAREIPFDVALASSSSMAPYLQLPELTQVPAIVDLVDLDSEKWLEYGRTSRGPKAWLYRTEGTRLRQRERDLKKWTRAITLVSQSEADLYRKWCGDGPVHAVSNGVDLEYFVPRAAPEHEVSAVFVGALDYRPNVDGICWFCEEIWPAIHRQHPELKIYLVGRQPVPAVKRLGEIEGVVVVGQVDDVRPHIAKATFAIVPLRIARGIQNKVLEAMAMGRPVIASPEPLVGLAVQRGRDVLEAITPEDWQQHVATLLRDRELRLSMGQRAREYVETHHCWERRLAPFAELIGSGRSVKPKEPAPR